jgi:hypothetical protein
MMKTLPKHMSGLPVDERGYVIPWFVDYIDGKPEFRAMDQRKYIRAVRENLCWVCGGRLGVQKCFVAGPMGGVNRTSSEPPCHLDCGRWSAKNCPFLSNPRMVRREDEQFNKTSHAENAPGMAILRNPGVTMLWVTREYEIFNDGKGRPLIQMGEPESVEWYFEGRKATREEVQRSVDTGIPSLEIAAKQQEGALPFLRAALLRFEKFLPTPQPEAANERRAQ